jgi:hypothetical protein
MVVVGGDNRFYGRSATGNVRLTEGEVARLYERRRRWEGNREALLDEVIGRAPIEAHEDFAYLHLIARPVVPDENLLDRAKGEQHVAQFLNGLFAAAMSAEVFPRNYSPDLSQNNTYERLADGWAAYQSLDENGQPYSDPSTVLSVQVDLNGGGHLFCGRAAEVYNGRLLVFEDIVAGLTARFLTVMGSIFAAGSYWGPVDVGLGITGLKGGISYILNQRLGVCPRPFDKEEYRRTEQFSASTLQGEPRAAARSLVLPLTRAITRESYDPFSDT